MNLKHWIYTNVLGDFDINGLCQGKYIFDKPDKFRQFYKELSLEIKKIYCVLFGIQLYKQR